MRHFLFLLCLFSSQLLTCDSCLIVCCGLFDQAVPVSSCLSVSSPDLVSVSKQVFSPTSVSYCLQVSSLLRSLFEIFFFNTNVLTEFFAGPITFQKGWFDNISLLFVYRLICWLFSDRVNKMKLRERIRNQSLIFSRVHMLLSHQDESSSVFSQETRVKLCSVKGLLVPVVILVATKVSGSFSLYQVLERLPKLKIAGLGKKQSHNLIQPDFLALWPYTGENASDSLYSIPIGCATLFVHHQVLLTINDFLEFSLEGTHFVSMLPGWERTEGGWFI